MYTTEVRDGKLWIRIGKEPSDQLKKFFESHGYKSYGKVFIGRSDQEEVIDRLKLWEARTRHINKNKPTLCWQCEHAGKGNISPCEWVKRFKPVDGWTATQTILNCTYTEKGRCRKTSTISYVVEKCPLFKRERPRRSIENGY